MCNIYSRTPNVMQLRHTMGDCIQLRTQRLVVQAYPETTVGRISGGWTRRPSGYLATLQFYDSLTLPEIKATRKNEKV